MEMTWSQPCHCATMPYYSWEGSIIHRYGAVYQTGPYSGAVHQTQPMPRDKNGMLGAAWSFGVSDTQGITCVVSCPTRRAVKRTRYIGVYESPLSHRVNFVVLRHPWEQHTLPPERNVASLWPLGEVIVTLYGETCRGGFLVFAGVIYV